MFARSQPPTSDPSTIFKVACDRLRTFNDARGGQTRFASRIRANPTGRGRREREREEWRNEGPGGIVIPSTSLVSLSFSSSSSSSLLSSQVRTFFSLFLFEEGKGVENRERYPFLDSLPERQSLLRFTTVFRKMYRRAPRYTTNCPSLVLSRFSVPCDIYDNRLCRSRRLPARGTRREGEEIPSKIGRSMYRFRG